MKLTHFGKIFKSTQSNVFMSNKVIKKSIHKRYNNDFILIHYQMTKNKNLFPVISKSTKNVLICQKLNTKSFKHNYLNNLSLLRSGFYKTIYECNLSISLMIEYFEKLNFNDDGYIKLNKFQKELIKLKYDIYMYFKDILDDNHFVLDLHFGNFGFDKNGKIKCFDPIYIN